MQPFNVANLKKAVSLSCLTNTDVDLHKITVKEVTYSGDTYPEGVIPLKVGAKHAINLNELNRLDVLLNTIWRNSILVQIGVKNHKPVLYVYQERR